MIDLDNVLIRYSTLNATSTLRDLVTSIQLNPVLKARAHLGPVLALRALFNASLLVALDAKI